MKVEDESAGKYEESDWFPGLCSKGASTWSAAGNGLAPLAVMQAAETASWKARM